MRLEAHDTHSRPGCRTRALRALNPAYIRGAGFTLVEMAVVLVIIGLLLGGLLIPLSTQMENDRRKETQATLAAIREALIGYAVINDRLPCADTNNPPDGRENCPSTWGWLPYADLGVSATDAWGNPWRYKVSGGFITPFYRDTARDINVGTVDNGCSSALLAANVPALVRSNAKTSYGGGLEAENEDGDTCFIDAGYVQGSAGFFDDLVTWISPGVLFSRMVAAGRDVSPP